jgi:hypothetical protein
MPDNMEILHVLQRHGIPFIIIGGHAVNFHGYQRITEDTDIVWLRSDESEKALMQALSEIDARYIGKEIDPGTGIEKTYPVTLSFIQSSHLMMLCTSLGFLDLFDYIPGAPDEDVAKLMKSSIESEGLRFASLDWLRQMKRTTGRPKDKLDLENLPD